METYLITLEQLPNNSINLFKDITKIEELVANYSSNFYDLNKKLN